MRRRNHERHQITTIGWLRASVLGANDGIVSTSSLILGVAAAQATHANIVMSGVAGLVAGAMSMAIGEYLSVHSQADTEAVALAQERAELAEDFPGERLELTEIYVRRGLERSLARQVAEQLMAHDALAAHARDELGMSEHALARPFQAAVASASSFALGAAIPLVVVLICPPPELIPGTIISSLLALLCLGAISARISGANLLTAAVRVAAWSALAMGITAGIGALFGTATRG